MTQMLFRYDATTDLFFSSPSHSLEILDDRYATWSTLATSQLPVEHWHQTLGDSTMAEAILHRLHDAYRLYGYRRRGDSMRKHGRTGEQNHPKLPGRPSRPLSPMPLK